MKKILLLLSVLSVVIFGCEKDAPTQLQEKLYAVNFQVPDFSSNTAPIAKSRTSISAVGDTLSNYVNTLNYQLYTSDGSYVKSVEQSAGQPGFGTVADSLPAGSYTAVFAAYYSSNTRLYNKTSPLSSLTLQSLVPFWDNSFVKKLSFTVNAAPITQNIRLDRVGGAIVVAIEDQFPPNVNRIMLEIFDDVEAYRPGGTSTFSIKGKVFLQPTTVKGSTKEYHMHIYNTFKPFTLLIKALDSSGLVVAEKTVNNVTVYWNKRTLLSGKLFSASSSSAGFQISVNPAWDISTPVISF